MLEAAGRADQLLDDGDMAACEPWHRIPECNRAATKPAFGCHTVTTLRSLPAVGSCHKVAGEIAPRKLMSDAAMWVAVGILFGMAAGLILLGP